MMRTIALDHLDFTRIVRPGDTVLWAQTSGEPVALVERLMEQRHEIGPFRVFLGGSYAGTVRPEHADVVSLTGMGAVGTNRALCEAGVIDTLPCNVSEVPRLLSDGILAADVVIMQIVASETGMLSVGPFNGYLEAALGKARVVLAELNDRSPWTYARAPVDEAAIDIAVPVSRAPVTLAAREPSDTDRMVATNIAELIEDEAIIQLGIGVVPDAVAGMISDRRDLGIHSGIIGDAVADLMEAGVITNRRKPLDVGKTVTGGLLGTERIYQFADRNPDILVEPVTYTHDPSVLRMLTGLVAINSALEVDLTGQVGAEVAGTRYVGTIGGHTDFVRGAISAPRGRSIVGLPARTHGGVSRLVPRLRSGVTTTGRADADTFVTEFGVAELRGQPIRERVWRLLAIAHPDDRDELECAARSEIAGF